MSNARNRYRWGICNSSGEQTWSKAYDGFDECYADYTRAMSALMEIGTNLALYQWRGVFNLDQAALLVNDRNIYADLLYVHDSDPDGLE